MNRYVITPRADSPIQATVEVSSLDVDEILLAYEQQSPEDAEALQEELFMDVTDFFLNDARSQVSMPAFVDEFRHALAVKVKERMEKWLVVKDGALIATKLTRCIENDADPEYVDNFIAGTAIMLVQHFLEKGSWLTAEEANSDVPIFGIKGQPPDPLWRADSPIWNIDLPDHPDDEEDIDEWELAQASMTLWARCIPGISESETVPNPEYADFDYSSFLKARQMRAS